MSLSTSQLLEILTLNYSSGSQLGAILFPTGRLAVSEDTVSRHDCVYAGIYWAEIQDAAQHPTMQSAPTTKNYVAQNIKNAEAEKP